MQLRFLGGAGTVTGSKVLVEYEGRRLLVDCGLFQGLKQLRLHNWSALPMPTSSIDAVVLTHAHIDHSGFLPRLVELGFKGPVFATGATADLCQVLLPESGRLQEEEAHFANRRGYTRHAPALPLYTESAARRALEYLQVRPFHEAFEPVAGFELRLLPRWPCARRGQRAPALRHAQLALLRRPGLQRRPGDGQARTTRGERTSCSSSRPMASAATVCRRR